MVIRYKRRNFAACKSMEGHRQKKSFIDKARMVRRQCSRHTRTWLTAVAS